MIYYFGDFEKVYDMILSSRHKYSQKGNNVNIKNFLIFLMLVLTACEGGKRDHVIAKIPEASGICYDKSSKTLFAVSDRGTVYELSLDGKKIRKKHIGNFDTEGIACDNKNNRLLVISEGVDNIMILNKKNLTIEKKINIKRSFNGQKILQKDKEYGIEGVTIDNKGYIYICNQSHHKYPHPDPSVIIIIKDLNKTKTKILSIIDPRKKDIAGLDFYDGYLYMVSDTNDRLYRYNFKEKRIDAKAKLPKFAQEGVAFDDYDNIYFADDNGRILKYSANDLL